MLRSFCTPRPMNLAYNPAQFYEAAARFLVSIHFYIRTMKNFLESLFLKPWFGGVTAVLTVLAGSLASFYTDEIKTCYWFWPFITSAQISWHASLFWLAVCSTGVSLSGSSWAQSRAARRERQALQQETGGLRDETAALKLAVRRIESLPPEGFLAEYQAMLARAFRSTIATSIETDLIIQMGHAARNTESPVVVHIEQAIRNILGVVLQLAKTYDKDRSAATMYGANIMLYRQNGFVTEVLQHRLINAGHDHPDYVGYLQAIPALSTTTAIDGCVPDPALVELVIHIPRDRQPVTVDDGSTKYPVTPGAAWSLVNREFVSFPTISSLDEWLHDWCSVDESIKSATRRYFRDGPGKNIKSFVSMPIFALSPTSDSGCIGILNIHSNQDGLLVEKGGERFSPLMEPFRQLLSILLTLARSDLAVFHESNS